MTILSTHDLKKVYGSGESEVRALDGVNFQVEKGEFVEGAHGAVLFFRGSQNFIQGYKHVDSSISGRMAA